MALIDTNALREYYKINEHCEECYWNNRDCNKPPYYSTYDICRAIDEVPTIDAIPVEWLREKIKEHTDEEGWQDYLENSFGLCIEAWQKEHEVTI